jgi:hypothetical protein
MRWLLFLAILSSVSWQQLAKLWQTIGGSRGGSVVGLKKKEEATSRVADSMTEKFVATKQCQEKRMEKIQLKHDTTIYYVSVCTLSAESADGNLARAFMNSKIKSNTDRIEQIMKWFDDKHSPSNMP